MTRITNTDQVILLLRNQLQKMDKTGKKKVSRANVKKDDAELTPLRRVSAMNNDEGLSNNEIHRALIGGILTEEFGTGFTNDPAFQKLIDDVLNVISSDAKGKDLLGSAMAQLKKTNL